MYYGAAKPKIPYCQGKLQWHPEYNSQRELLYGTSHPRTCYGFKSTQIYETFNGTVSVLIGVETMVDCILFKVDLTKTGKAKNLLKGYSV